jgi:hypothetical protein
MARRSRFGPGTGGKYYSQDMADYVVKFLQEARRVHHLDINCTGIWNEVVYLGQRPDRDKSIAPSRLLALH